MTLENKIKSFLDEIIAEISSNPAFAERLQKVLDGDAGESNNLTKRRRRRTPAQLDPVKVLELENETALKDKLLELNIEQLKDIVAEYGMDQARLVMKWKDNMRIIDHIIGTSQQRAKKGDVFRT